MLRLFGLLVCLISFVTCRSLYNPYSWNGNQQRGYMLNDWEQPWGNYWGRDQGRNAQFISDVEGRTSQMISDLRGFEDQRRSDMRGQRDQFISDIGGSDGGPWRNHGSRGWW